MARVNGDWTCIGCERTFRGDQPAFIEADNHAASHLICIDCSH